MAVSTGVDLLTALFVDRLGRQDLRFAGVCLCTLSAPHLTAAIQNRHRGPSFRYTPSFII